MLTPTTAAVKFSLPSTPEQRLARRVSVKGSIRFGRWSSTYRTLPMSINPFIRSRRPSSGNSW